MVGSTASLVYAPPMPHSLPKFRPLIRLPTKESGDTRGVMSFVQRIGRWSIDLLRHDGSRILLALGDSIPDFAAWLSAGSWQQRVTAWLYFEALEGRPVPCALLMAEREARHAWLERRVFGRPLRGQPPEEPEREVLLQAYWCGRECEW